MPRNSPNATDGAVEEAKVKIIYFAEYTYALLTDSFYEITRKVFPIIGCKLIVRNRLAVEIAHSHRHLAF